MTRAVFRVFKELVVSANAIPVNQVVTSGLLTKLLRFRTEDELPFLASSTLGSCADAELAEWVKMTVIERMSRAVCLLNH